MESKREEALAILVGTWLGNNIKIIVEANCLATIYEAEQHELWAKPVARILEWNNDYWRYSFGQMNYKIVINSNDEITLSPNNIGEKLHPEISLKKSQ